MLDRQLTQPPEPGHPFRVGKSPLPGTLNWAPAVFERILERGTDPDIQTFREPNEEAETFYNLFVRVAEHIPSSPDWLFKQFEPYFHNEPPPVDYANLLIDCCLRRLHMRRLSAEAAAFAAKYQPERTAEIGRQVLAALSERPDPIHLVLLYALYHERQWHQPNSAESDELARAFIRAYEKFIKREEFTSTDTARTASAGLTSFFYQLDRAVLHRGHRSMPSDPNFNSMWHPNVIIGHQFEGADELDLLTTMGVAVPIWCFLYEHLPPSHHDSLAALDRLCAEAATSVEDWRTYDTERPDAFKKLRRRYIKARQRRSEPQSQHVEQHVMPETLSDDLFRTPNGIDPYRLTIRQLGTTRN